MLYTMVDDIFYKRGCNGVLLKYITQTEGISLLHDIHEGIYGSHISHQALVGKPFRQEFYWPIALQDAANLVRMRIRPIFSEADTLAGSSVKYHPTILAIRHMGY